jgi:enterobactin synthetase component D
VTRAQRDNFLTSAAGFLGTPRVQWFEDALQIDAPYDIQAYDISLFLRLNITCPDRISKAIEKRQAEYLAGRCAAKLALYEHGLSPQDIPPGADRAPIWPSGLRGSISHTRHHCGCVLTENIGLQPAIDIEHIVDEKKFTALNGVVLSQHDQRVLAASDLSRLTAATLAFSAKESLFKGLYPSVRRIFGFDYAQITQPPKEGRLVITLTKPLSETLVAGRLFTLEYDICNGMVFTRFQFIED